VVLENGKVTKDYIKNMQQGQMKRLAEGGEATDESVSGKLGLTPREAPAQKTELTAGETVTPTPIVEQPTEQIDPINVGTTPTTALSTASETDLSVAKPQATAAAQYTAYTVPDTPEAIAAQGTLSQESKIGDVQGTVSQEAVAAAAQGTVSEKATVKYQLGQLFESIKTGEELPAWAEKCNCTDASKRFGCILYGCCCNNTIYYGGWHSNCCCRCKNIRNNGYAKLK